MKPLCPYCEWPEFSPVGKVEQVRTDILGRVAAVFGITLFRRAGKVVHCTRCAEQFAIGERGAYRIKPGQATTERPAEPSPPQKLALVDEDTAELWRR